MLRVAPHLPLVVDCSSIRLEHPLVQQRVVGSIPTVFILKYVKKAKVCDTRQLKCTYSSVI